MPEIIGYVKGIIPALSCSSPSLGYILSLCEPFDVRVAAWVKPFCCYKKGVRPAYAWEPVIFYGGRNDKPPIPEKGGECITPKDSHIAPITMETGLVGAKPESFCRWILTLLNYQRGDTLVDLYPGTGVMARVLSQEVFDFEPVPVAQPEQGVLY